MPAGNKFGVVPKDAKTRLNKQRAVGTSRRRWRRSCVARVVR
jgi:hypothetical protein